MLQYSIKDFKLMNILENKYGIYKAVNFNDDICIIYGGDEGATCTRSIIYFIDRKQFKFYHALTQEAELIVWFLLIIYFMLLYIIELPQTDEDKS